MNTDFQGPLLVTILLCASFALFVYLGQRWQSSDRAIERTQMNSWEILRSAKTDLRDFGSGLRDFGYRCLWLIGFATRWTLLLGSAYFVSKSGIDLGDVPISAITFNMLFGNLWRIGVVFGLCAWTLFASPVQYRRWGVLGLIIAIGVWIYAAS